MHAGILSVVQYLPAASHTLLQVLENDHYAMLPQDLSSTYQRVVDNVIIMSSVSDGN